MEHQTATPMGSVQTLAQRKQARVEEIRAGVACLREALAAYGRAHGGRFLIYESAVSGRLHYDSDVDLLVDFPAPHTSAAVDFVEEACGRLKLKVDVQPRAWCKDAFLARITPQAQVLP
jgi:predicted nucleotidyltransferase